MKRTPLLFWNVLMGLSMAVMAGALLYEKLVPYPAFSLTAKAKAEQIQRAHDQAENLGIQADLVKTSIAGRVWNEEAEEIGPKAMATATDLAKRFNLKLSSFRPQKIVLDGELERIPYVVALEGEYRDVVQFLNEIEMPATKLVLNSIQIASSDGASSVVRATIGLWALRWPKAPKDLWPAPNVEIKPETVEEPIKQTTRAQGESIGRAS